MSALIKAVEKRSPADKAGIKAGEKLISINGSRIRDV
ncbi:MAG: PDZ domain-containing protein, partial [Clostridia bacterium]|nr:PDZ domain-containing protein [Clostridia bacterium]